MSDLRFGVIGLGLRRSLAMSAPHPGQKAVNAAQLHRHRHRGVTARRRVTGTSPLAARMSVSAGVLATRSLRQGGAPHVVPALDAGLVAYFARGQVRS
ncbi:hypothetical protein ACFYPA_07385 [Streptomyces sp. NPDC005775]|uniref:hypothetical protein n=1 Tax=Streptomyces sp. NPDC005775 TaxID=3364729 RepID=UPI0036A9F981